jgi:hypothetical protein
MGANMHISKEGFKGLVFDALNGEDSTGTCNISIDGEDLVQALKELSGQADPEPVAPKPKGGLCIPKEATIANKLKQIINSGDK